MYKFETNKKRPTNNQFKVTFHPMMKEVIRKRAERFNCSISGYLRKLIMFDLCEADNLEPLQVDEITNQTFSFDVPFYMKKLVPRRADQTMCLSSTDYIRTLVYFDLLLAGDIEFNILDDLSDDLW